MLLALLGLLVLPAPDGYGPAVDALPPGHWALVRSVSRTNDSAAWASASGAIGVPADPRPAALWHEVGHLVSWANGDHLLRSWRPAFWPAGRPVGSLPTAYAGSNAAEDFAESYATYIAGPRGLDYNRCAWLAAYVFGQPAAVCRVA